MNKNNLKLWYEKPAYDWNEALPLGNGKLGAMVFGGVGKERIQINEDSLWSGGHIDRHNPDCFASLGEIRELLKNGNIEKAERLALYSMTGNPDSQRCYQSLGDIHLTLHLPEGQPECYSRQLDLSDAICLTRYRVGGVSYSVQVFASQPDNVIAIKIAADSPGSLGFHVRLERRRHADRSWNESGNRIACDGGAPELRFCCMMDGSCNGGKLSAKGDYIVVENADEAVLLLTAGTTFRHENPHEYCRKTLSRAAEKGYERILESHLQEYRPYFERSFLDIEGDESAEGLPTDKRLALYSQSPSDSGLIALYYHFGRYLLISSSRPGSLPANLQGIWCKDFTPPWDSKYTININTEMNYWPAEICNLPQMHAPLFDHLKRMYPNGRVTAQRMYGCGGWLCHHNTDIWGDTAPQDSYIAATYWVLGAAWLCTHIWEHYQYSPDLEFLDEHYYLIREACVFLLDYMIEDEKGRLMISPSLSPENTYELPNGSSGRLCRGCAMDSQIIRHIFCACKDAAGILGKDYELAGKIDEALAKIPPVQIGSDGRIMEWLDEHIEKEPGHRHISHLYALFPGGDGVFDDPRSPHALAARKTLEQRLMHGGGHTGWSRAWIINFWVRLHDAGKVQENIDQLLIKSTLPNLFDNHPPFQIDGNFGGIAGIAHCIMSSSENAVTLLSALPPRWKRGSATGLRAKGGLQADISWDEGSIDVSLTAFQPYEGALIYGGDETRLKLKAGQSLKFSFAIK
ncbi:MAG: glycosyl hydrolase family 95 catalytic domain-containing protein [Christensenellales bacterium]|jgi:alpha-L-fucosidase 2